jgi:hypothetical protein
MSEKDQRRRVVKALRDLHAVAVENPARVGTPDVNFADGWIELKWLRQWPSKDETPVRFPHFTINQKNWIQQRHNAKGKIWLLIQCKKEWVLLDGPTAVEIVGQVPKTELVRRAIHYWPNGLNPRELATAISQPNF